MLAGQRLRFENIKRTEELIVSKMEFHEAVSLIAFKTGVTQRLAREYLEILISVGQIKLDDGFVTPVVKNA